MRLSVTPPALTASSGLDVAVVSSSSVTPEPARASREWPKGNEDVILVKFVLLVSVHTTSVNGAQFSEASMCLNVLQVVVLMESSTQKLGADTAIARLSHTWSPAFAVQEGGGGGRHHGLPHLICSLKQGQPQCLFLIHDQIPVSHQQ